MQSGTISCAGKGGEQDVEDVEVNPLRARMRTAASAPVGNSTRREMGDVMDVDEEKGNPIPVLDIVSFPCTTS